ncbi:MAG: hypothetical protein H6R00_2875 [Proteobacteria bacterium]|nr:hypothetical protein [Pseudomonadota bacterium]
MPEGFLQDHFDAGFFGAADQAFTDGTTNITKLARRLAFDPKRDFRYADLTGVDFSESDIRGWDFTGADLRGAHGIGVKMDDDPLIDGADVEGSLFALRAERRALLLRHPELRPEVNRRASMYWSDAALWTDDQLRKSGPVTLEKAALVRAVFSLMTVPDSRAAMVPFMGRALAGKREYHDFLMHLFASDGVSGHVGRNAVMQLSQNFRDEPGAFGVLKRIALDVRHDGILRRWALEGVLASCFFSDAVTDIMQASVELNEDGRRAFVGAFAQRFGKEAHEAVKSASGKYLDLPLRLTYDKAMKLAEGSLSREKREYGWRDAPPAFSDKRAEGKKGRAQVIVEHLERLQEAGLPITFASDIALLFQTDEKRPETQKRDEDRRNTGGVILQDLTAQSG